MRCLAAVALFLLVVCLAALHLSLFTAWYSFGRKLFTRGQNVHFKDIELAIKIAEAAPSLDEKPLRSKERRLALLFMLRTGIVELELWRRWLQPDQDKSQAAQRVSLYFHVADGLDAAGQEAVASLEALPGARRVLRPVATGWCELMAAEVALLQAALSDDPGAEMFVLLPHDATPLWPLRSIVSKLLDRDSRPVSRICPAGVRDLEVPHDCSHGIEPHWSRSLLLKHHQWLALSRQHALRVASAAALRAADGVFESSYLGEPLCSDEVLPLLTMALKQEQLSSSSGLDLSELHLYQMAALGLRDFEDSLTKLGARSECILYAPWPGCSVLDQPSLKRAKSPLLGGGLLPADRDALLQSLASMGVLFARKLGTSGGNVTAHLAMLEGLAFVDQLPPAPRRLFPLPAQEQGGLLVLARWWLASMKARLPPSGIVALCSFVAMLAGQSVLSTGMISRRAFTLMVGLYTFGHLVVFLVSVAAFAEYSLLEPFRKAGLARNVEL